jgi:hypothetical protein
MCKRFLGTLLVLVITTTAWAFTVDETEVGSTAGREVDFVSYEGPHERIDTITAIRGIGRNLGTAIAGGAARSGEVGRYMIIHAIDPATRIGLDADILVIGEGALVDHIQNLRRIIAGYLETAYGYSTRDADTLAIFITVYNAVYRNNIAYFASRYKPVVMQHLNEQHAGLSFRWTEWAGRTRMVIPLTSRAAMGVIGSIDTSSITDPPTIDQLRAEAPTVSIDKRQDIVDIKERDVEQERAAIDAEKARIEAARQALELERARAVAERPAASAVTPQPAVTPAAATPAAATPAAAPADQTPGTVPATTSTTTPVAPVAVTTAAAEPGSEPLAPGVADDSAAADQPLAAEDALLAEALASLQEREAAVAAKEQEIADDRVAIAREQNKAIREEIEAAAARRAMLERAVPLIELIDPAVPLARIILLDLETGTQLRQTSITTIRPASLIDIGEAFVALAGQVTVSGGAIRMVRVSKSDYDDFIYGTDTVFPETSIWYYGSSLYALVELDGSHAIGRFDTTSLKRAAISAPVSRWTFLSNLAGRLVAQAPGGDFLVLNAQTLEILSEVDR